MTATLSALAVAVQENVKIEDSQTVWEFLVAGGLIMIPLAICSVAVLTLTLERLLALKREKVVPGGLAEAIDRLRAGRLDEAGTLAEQLDAPGARILVAGIRRRGRRIEDVERAMEDQGSKEADKLRANVRPLQLIASVAPLLGLLGTVIGIQDSFAVIVKAGMGKPEHLAGGIEKALVTTIAGLAIAIPAMLIASHFNQKIRRLMGAADELLAPAVELLAGEEPHGAS